MSLRAVMCRWLVPILCLLLPGQAMAAGVSSGSMRFDVHYGAQGFKVGEARHDWKVGPKDYAMTLNLEAKGLASLFGLQYEQRSSGTVGPAGLQPDVFSVDQR